MTISTYKLNRITFFPISNPTILVAFPLLIFAVWMVNIQCNNIIKSTQLTFIAKIFKEFGFVVFVILVFFGTTSTFRFTVSLMLTFIAAISKAFRLVGFTTNQAFITSPSVNKIAFCATIGTSPRIKYSKFFAAIFTIIMFHNVLLYMFAIYLSNKNILYCQIAEERLRAVDTGVSVKEARAGQRALFGE